MAKTAMIKNVINCPCQNLVIPSFSPVPVIRFITKGKAIIRPINTRKAVSRLYQGLTAGLIEIGFSAI